MTRGQQQGETMAVTGDNDTTVSTPLSWACKFRCGHHNTCLVMTREKPCTPANPFSPHDNPVPMHSHWPILQTGKLRVRGKDACAIERNQDSEPRGTASPRSSSEEHPKIPALGGLSSHHRPAAP